MANTIEAVSIKNPFGYNDVCAHITTESRSNLTISNCMPYVSTYAYQFWIKGTSAKTISFSCGSVFKKFDVTKDWQYFSIIFDVETISNIHLEFPKGQYWIYNMKLEIGQYLTDWSPHPEDGISAYEEKFDNIEKLLVQHASSIQNTISMVDKTNQEILNSVSKTTFESEIIGMQKSISDRFTDVEDGYGKWYVSIFDKSKFKNVYYDKEEVVDTSDDSSVVPPVTDTTEPVVDTGDEGSSGSDDTTGADDSTEESGNTNPEPSTTDNTTNNVVTTALVDRECNDMSIFGLENANVVPTDELLVNDDPIAMRIDGKGKILYYLAFAKFNQNTRVDINCSHNKGSVYLNGILKQSFDTIGTNQLIFDFSDGWNIIEMVANEGNMSFGTKISEHPNCVLFNCLMGVPTSRTSKIHEQGASLNIYLDKIVSEVFDTTQETKDGITTRKVERSKIEQNKEMIDFVVERKSDVDPSSSSSSKFTITADAVSAITPQMVIEGPPGTGTTVISGGNLLANSITSNMLNTNAIMSQNFIAHNVTDVTSDENPDVNPDVNSDEPSGTDEGSSGDEDSSGEAQETEPEPDPYADVQWSQSGSFLDLANGNFYTPSLYLKNEVKDNDGNVIENAEAWFKGTILAENGKFNGTITSIQGEIGGWNINEQGIWRGAETFAAATSRGMYLGKSGINLGSKLIYQVDERSEALRLNIDALSIVGKPTNEQILKNGTRLYSNAGEPPTTSNKDAFPFNAWEDIDSYADHVNDIYLDNTTGKTYVFKRSQEARYKIKFNASSALRPARDYIQIFYIYEKSMHKVIPIITAEFGQDEIIIPTENFYIYWHVGDSTSGLDDRYKYGFEIESVTPIDDVTTELSRNIALQNLPAYPIDASLNPGEFPKTPHPYTQANYNKIWYCKGLTDDAQFYEWEEIEDVDLSPSTQDVAESLSYLHYDIQNGLILYNNTSLNDNYEYVRAALPDKVLNKQELDSIIDGNIRLSNSGLDIYKGNSLLASYGDTINLYKNDALIASYGDSTIFYRVENVRDPLNPDELIKQSFPVTTIDSDGMKVYKVDTIPDPNDSDNFIKTIFPVVSYGDITTFYKIVEVEESNGKVKRSLPVTSIDSNGLNIYDTQGNMIANYGDSIKFYKIGTNTIATTLDDTGLNINSGSITLGKDENNNDVFKVTSAGELTAINANIGGVTVANNGIYSPNHSTYNSNTPGFFLGSDGHFGVGDNNSFIQFYKDGNDWKLRLSVSSLSIEGNEVSTDDPDYSDDFANAGQTATNYLYYDTTNGLVIHSLKSNFSADTLADTNYTLPYVKLTTSGLEIYNNRKKLAEYGSTTYFYDGSGTASTNIAAQFGANGFEVKKGKIGDINITSSAIWANTHSSWASGDGFYFGSNGYFGVGNSSSYIRYNGSSLEINVSSFLIGGKSVATEEYANTHGPSSGGSSSSDTTSAYLTFIGSSNDTNYPAGLYISQGVYSGYPHMLITNSNIRIRNGSNELARFGSNIDLYGGAFSIYSSSSSTWPMLKLSTTSTSSELMLRSSDYYSTFTTTQGSGLTIRFNGQTYPALVDVGVNGVYLGTSSSQYNSSSGKTVYMNTATVKGTLTCGTLSCATFSPTSLSMTGNLSCAYATASATVNGKNIKATANIYLDSIGGSVTSTGDVDGARGGGGRIYAKTYKAGNGNYLPLISINTENKVHIGAQNHHDVSFEDQRADAIYLDAPNVYYGTGTPISTSDMRLKHDIKDIEHSKEFIMQLIPKIFKFDDNTSNRYHAGFIAQDVEKAMNNTIGDFGVFCKVDLYETNKEEDLVCMIRYDEIIAPHVAVTQEHEHRIQEQEEEITNLKSEVADLKEQIKLLLEKLGDK